MALVYEPGDALAFNKPFKAVTQDVLRLTNKNNSPVAFKVKTTAPKQYCVRPNAGRIEPGDSVEVQVVLQPMKEEPPVDFKCRDKFLVQSIQITPEMESMPMTELWAMVEREAKSSINEKKLRVRYTSDSTPSNGTQQPQSPVDDNAEKGVTSPTQQQQQKSAAPQRASHQNRALPGPSPLARAVEDHGESPAEDDAMTKEAPAVADKLLKEASNRLFPETSAATSPGDTTMYYATDNAMVGQSSDADQELVRAKATIKDLERQLADYKHKLSEKASTSGKPLVGKAASQLQSSPVSVDGLSMNSVAIIAFVAFLIGYFFF
ncbi:phosphatidylinositol-binding protein scs2 [Coemansia aciculifera]|uniref:Phosphatidylinositol-binding protein scs2 n=1 Tax=Coemansia aciculifera TaxID=417176 RepID=A0A9W8IHN3_9FUNG|nr:phosphatidylinositol-binding protein scs2 [Coemansia aciculifera]KAJ2876666.1 phosphatidylinositol-binding protein scs2 [Coemansia aciculifera]